MPYYKGVIDQVKVEAGVRTARKVASQLLSLRNRLKQDIPQRNVTDSILLATWNIREFGRNQKAGVRLPESLLYIAEIISHFDLVAVQEVNQNLADLKQLVELLGDWWEYIVTDVTEGAAGNQERIAYVYDGRKVRFDHLAGELALPAKGKPAQQPARSPFLCAFRTGWRRISLCSVHIYYGKSNPNDPRRVKEIAEISELLAKRNKRRQNIADGEPENSILIGDMNVFNQTGDKTTEALAKNQFIIPKEMKTLEGRNLTRDKYFDQIAFHDPQKRLHTSQAGVFNFSKILYKDDDEASHAQAMERSAPVQYKKARDKSKFYKNWRTFQISDHLPLWLELQTDFANAYLASVMRGKKKDATAAKGNKSKPDDSVKIKVPRT